MYHIVVRQPGIGDAEGLLPNGVYLVGSGPECQIRIARPDVSLRQLQLIVRDRRLLVTDLESDEGTWLGERQLFSHQPTEVPDGAEIRFGKARIHAVGYVDENNRAPAPEPEEESEPESLPPPQPETPRAPPRADGTKQAIPLLEVSGIDSTARPLIQEIKKKAHPELLKRLNLKKLVLSGVSETELKERAKQTIREILSQLSIELPDGVTIGQLERELIQEATGLGPLEYLIEREDITEVMVNGPDQIYVEKDGVIYRTDTAFADPHQVLAAIERIVSPLGRRIDESSPMVDARLPDGSRVNAIIPPLSLVGPTITIRKFARKRLTMDKLIELNSISAPVARFLEICVAVRKNIIISGGTGSGKTTLLNVLSSFLPNRERIITIEDAAELQLDQEHLVRLESRPPNIEGRGEIAIRDLVRNSLRMRPDRIVVGECRGGEALDMLQAMNTGHDGSLTTIHANSPRDALARLETLVLMAGFDLPLRAIREQVASAIDIVVQISRERDGSRKVTQVSEITKMEGDIISMQDLFVFKTDGWDGNNRLLGHFEATGSVPTFLEDIERARLQLDLEIFRKPAGGRYG